MSPYTTRFEATARQKFLNLRWDTRTSGPEYQDAVRAAKKSWQHQLVDLEYESHGKKIRIGVSRDALRIAGVRINGSPLFQQEIADALGLVLLTPTIADEIYRQAANQLVVATEPAGQYMGTVGAMVSHSDAVDSLIGGREGISSDPGKDWVLSSRGIANYGMRDPNDGGRPIQGLGTVHNLWHSDYSQIMRFASPVVCIGSEKLSTEAAYLRYPHLFGSPTSTRIESPQPYPPRGAGQRGGQSGLVGDRRTHRHADI